MSGRAHPVRATPTRRAFLKTMGRGAGAAAGLWALRGRASGAEAAPPRKKVALLATEVRKYSHAQHFIDRLLEGYGFEGRHHRPPLELVSLYVDQTPEGDLSRDRSRRHAVTIYPTIAEALTRGGSNLAVDGVLIIGEHGGYPTNSKGQKLYPRYRFFKEMVKVFEASGRSAPVFNDKHLSTEWKECAEMVDDSRRLGFAFLAGSSLPVTWRIPALEIEPGTPLEESLCACYGGVDAYDIHGLETAQCMSERRTGGEAGVRSVHALRGAKVWSLLAERPQTVALLLAALSRSHTLSPPPGYSYAVPTLDHARRVCPEPVGYFIEHLDGFRTTLLLLNGLVQDFNWAGRVKGSDRLLSCQMYLPMPPAQSTLANFFSPLMRNIEETFLGGKATYPVERTLLTSGLVVFAVESLYRGEVPLLTPELKVAYAPPARSTFWRS
jgi:hypothetical protein